MNSYLIKNAKIVNEGTTFLGDLLIKNGLISKIDKSISDNTVPTIDAEGKYLIQV